MIFNRLKTKIQEKFKTQKAIVTVDNYNFKEDLQYIKRQLRPIKFKLEVLREKPLSVMIKCSAKYNLEEYLSAENIDFKIVE